MVFGDPDVKFIGAEIGRVTLEGGGVLPERVANENPAGVRPPLAVARRVRIAIVIGKLMMLAMVGDPLQRAAFHRGHSANGEQIFHPLWRGERAVREQAMEADAEAEAGGDPVESGGDEKSLPTEKEKCGDRADVKGQQDGRDGPVEAVGAGAGVGGVRVGALCGEWRSHGVGYAQGAGGHCCEKRGGGLCKSAQSCAVMALPIKRCSVEASRRRLWLVVGRGSLRRAWRRCWYG